MIHFQNYLRSKLLEVKDIELELKSKDIENKDTKLKHQGEKTIGGKETIQHRSVCVMKVLLMKLLF